jgi:hypothetical protein
MDKMSKKTDATNDDGTRVDTFYFWGKEHTVQSPEIQRAFDVICGVYAPCLKWSPHMGAVAILVSVGIVACLALIPLAVCVYLIQGHFMAVLMCGIALAALPCIATFVYVYCVVYQTISMNKRHWYDV